MPTCKDYFAWQGWECPKCGRVYSPSTSMCMYCGNESVSVNTNALLDFSAMKSKLCDVCDDSVKNNYNKIKRFNKDELAKFIVELTNDGEYTCGYCGYYEGGDGECQKDCWKGVKIWLEREAK